MNEKSKKLLKSFGRYFRDFSIVVAGIAVTLYITGLITAQSEKRDLKQYLKAIKLEMEENIAILDEEADYSEDWQKYAQYLFSHDKKSIPSDSIRNWYNDGFGIIKTIIFQTSAFEMFKTSGNMRLIDDKELLQSIWKSYLELEIIKSDCDAYYQLKREEALKEYIPERVENTNSIPMYNFFFQTTSVGISARCKNNSEKLKEIIAVIEKEVK